MRDNFYELADHLTTQCRGAEVLLLNFAGEDSDFVRLNQGLVRQAGAVAQRYLTVELVSGQRHASETVTVSGVAARDRAIADQALANLRESLPSAPEDPYLLYATEVTNTEQTAENKLPATADVLDAILAAGQGRDLVGMFAQGAVCRGFANSLGQRNWFSTCSFNLEWSLYAHDDKAVKSGYAGFEWSDAEFARKMQDAARQLDILGRPARTIDPGEYRVYLAPRALADFAGMLGWGGFGLKSHRTKSTCLLRMIENGAAFSGAFSACENTAEGLSPNFTAAGYIKPACVSLIREGRFDQCLVSPRSAREYGEQVNSGAESPASLDIAPGDVELDDVLPILGDGVYANQLWYLNWSDMPACRITGMTRFATFWVENGTIAAPLNVMRFDETAYRALGENLVGLTRERDFLPDSGTYGQRSTASCRAPGALVERFRLTL